MHRRTATAVLFLAGMAAIMPSAAAREWLQQTPSLPAPVHSELQDRFFMDDVLELLQNPRPRIEMHEYLTEEMGEFFFLITQPAGAVTIDEFRLRNPSAAQSLMLTMEMPAESLSMVHMLLTPDASGVAEQFIEGASSPPTRAGLKKRSCICWEYMKSTARSIRLCCGRKPPRPGRPCTGYISSDSLQ